MSERKREDLNMDDPTDRAIFISYHMKNPGMQSEVLGQYEDMATGGDGGYCDSFNRVTFREQYYKNVPNVWFSSVLREFDKLQIYKEMQTASG